MSAIVNPVPAPPAQPAAAPQRESPRSNRTVWLILLGLIVAGGLGYRYWTARQEAAQQAAAVVPIRTTKVVAGPLNHKVRVSGTISAREYVNVTAPRLMGPEGNRPLMLLKLVKSGTMVKKGDVIVEMDGQTLQDHIDDVHSTVIQSEADIKKRNAEQSVEWENLQQSVRVGKSQFDKLIVDSKASEVRTAIDQELIKLSVEEADAAYKELVAETKLKKISQGSEMKILDFTRERHTRHRDRHKNDVTKYTIKSPIDGLAVVQSLFRGGEFIAIGEGDQVFPGQLIVKVVNPRSMQLEGNVNQSESGSFRIGETADVSFDAFPGLSLKGEVYSIGAIAVSGFRQTAYLRTIPVRISMKEWDPRVIPDLSGAADVLVASSPNQTLVPRGAIRQDNDKTIAYVKQNGAFIPREVKLGERNATTAAVMAGLSAGDEVALNYEVAAK